MCRLSVFVEVMSKKIAVPIFYYEFKYSSGSGISLYVG